jgi:protein-S-isoprenylcysteine O-methyltransferase Ste14
VTGVFVGWFIALQAAFIWARYAIFRVDGPTPTGARAIEVSTLSCIVFGVALVLRHQPDDRTFGALALVAATSSTAVFAWALRSVRPRQLSAAFSGDEPTELLRHGAFRYVRNPFYLAYLLAHAVPLLASRSLWGLVLAWMSGLYVRATQVEERKFLASPLADEYRRYFQSTGRFVPRVAALSRDRAPGEESR